LTNQCRIEPWIIASALFIASLTSVVSNRMKGMEGGTQIDASCSVSLRVALDQEFLPATPLDVPEILETRDAGSPMKLLAAITHQ